MSTSSARAASLPSLSVVVASNGAPGSVEACLASLEGQLDGSEVIVCPRQTAEVRRDRFPFARFLEPAERLVPELWRDGIEAATGEAVALTISPMRARDDWVTTARSLVADVEAAAGAIEPGEGLRLRDVAEYFCRYAKDMLPFEPHACVELPGDNAIYRRSALEQTREVWRSGFWEPDVNRTLRDHGARLLHTPELVVFQGRSSGFRAFLSQRLQHGRAYGGQRGARFSRTRNAAGVLLAFAVPLVLAARSAREVFARRRHRLRFTLSLPTLLAYDIAWAAGEAAGHAAALRRR